MLAERQGKGPPGRSSCKWKNNSKVHFKVGPGVAYWLRYCATSRTISGSIPGGVTGDFFRS